MIWIRFFEVFKHEVYLILEFFVVFMYLHGVDHLDQRGKIFLFIGGLIVDVADEGGVEQGLGLDPEIVPGFGVAGGIGNQGGDQLQNILFRMNVLKRIIVHGFSEIDRVQNPDFIGLIDDLPIFIPDWIVIIVQKRGPMLEQLAALGQNTALWVSNDIGAVHLHEIGLEPEAGFAGTGATDDQHVFVSRCFRVLWAAVHGETFRFCQNDIVAEHWVNVGSDILLCTPPGRAILFVLAELLGVLAFDVYGKPDQPSDGSPHKQINEV